MKKDSQQEHNKAVNEGRQGYKHTPLGWIPEEWAIVRLGEIGKIVSGLTYDPKDVSPTGVLVLRSSNIQNKRLEFVDNVFVDVKAGDFNPVKIDDILICVRNGSKNLIGKNAIITEEAKGMAFGAFMAVFRSPENQFIHHVFDTDIYFREIHQNLGATINSINGSDLKLLKVPFPPKQERKMITSILSTWDQAITKTQQLIEQLKRRNKGLMGELLTGKRRLAQYTDKWQIVKIGDIITESRIPSVSNNPNKRITVRLNLKGVEKRSVRGTEAEDATYYFVRSQGQFIYGKQNLHKGAFGLIPEVLDQYESSQDIPAFDFSAGFDPNFFLYFLGQEQVYSSLEKYATGTGSKRIHPENLFRVQFRYPSFKEQKSIANILAKMSQELTLYENILFALHKQKKGMMQKLLTGNVRVKI